MYLTPTAEVEELGRGRYRHVQHIKPVAYEDHGLRAIDSGWRDSGVPGLPHLVTAAKLMTSVADDGMRRLHPTREADRYLEVGAPYVKVGGVWQKVGFAGALRDGNRITWSRPQADLTITHGGHFAKLDIELLGGYVPEDGLVAFPVGIQGLTRQGGLILADGEPVMRLRAPVVTDGDDPLDVRPIAGEFVSLDGQPYYLMRLPSLAGMARPIVDPTLELQPDESTSRDTCLTSYVSGVANWGTGNTLQLKDASRRGLIAFDLSSIASGMLCLSALFDIYQSWQQTARTTSIYAVKAANGDWIEGVSNGTQALAGEPCWIAKAADGAGGVTTAWAGSAGLSTPGTDYESVAIGSWVNSVGGGGGGHETAPLTPSVVQGWFGLATNPGMLLWGVQTDGYENQAYSSVSGVPDAPKLTVEYMEPRHVFY